MGLTKPRGIRIQIYDYSEKPARSKGFTIYDVSLQEALVETRAYWKAREEGTDIKFEKIKEEEVKIDG